MKSARLEWVQGNMAAAQRLLADGVAVHREEEKLWMMRGQVEEQLSNVEAARDYYARGRKNCPHAIPLWKLAAELEVKAGAYTRARSILEQGRTANPQCDVLWATACDTELVANESGASIAKTLMAKALQDVPASGLLWSKAIFMENKPARRIKSVDALKKCENDPKVRSQSQFHV